MRFELLTEGRTEKKAVRQFLHHAINSRLTSNVGLAITGFEGNGEYLRKVARKAQMFLNAPDAAEVIAVVGLLDLYGLPEQWQLGSTSEERYGEVKRQMEEQVGDRRFRQFFAVHETEAWLLSDPGVFPAGVQVRLQAVSRYPERVDLIDPPARRLNAAYQQELKRGYRKLVDGQALFSKLDPQTVMDKCPFFVAMIDEMVHLARSAGA